MAKKLDQLTFPDNLRYSDEHVWVRFENQKSIVGLDDFAQDQLGAIVFVELPEVGEVFNEKEVFATVESVKCVAECYLPVGGEVIAVNNLLEDEPELVNKDPYGDGWLVGILLDDTFEDGSMMTDLAYIARLREG
jgi:glycine cleavage system H protein